MYELGSLDWETYSEAGHVWDEEAQKWRPLPGAKTKGLSVVGLCAYLEHSTAEILCLAWRLPGETEKHLWRPGDPLPEPLFASLRAGGVFKAHNAMFELYAWEMVAVPKYGFPSLMPHRYQLRCTMATARTQGLPGALANLSDVLQLPTPKDAEGKRLLDKLSTPRNPTKTDPRRRVLQAARRPPLPEGKEAAKWAKTFAEDDADFEALGRYCLTDIEAEEQAAQRMWPMSADELLFWWIDQEINLRGVAIDRKGVRDCIAVLEGALGLYGDEFKALTGLDVTQLQATRGWLAAQGVHMASMDEEAIEDALKRTDLPPPARRALELRALTASASVKKLYAMENQASRDDRLRNLIVHHGARTGRPTGEGPQPLNLPKAGPPLAWCVSPACKRPFAPTHAHCPWCAAPTQGAEKTKWSHRAVDSVLEVMATRDVNTVAYFFGDALLAISGCVRGLFTAAPEHDLIASDYSAIEAVVIAVLAGEQWRIDAFRRKEDIYLRSCEKITGKTYEWYLAYAEQHGEHHEDRQKIGKINELANGFGGWINSSKAFGSDEPDDVIRDRIKAWRAASPAIVEFWGGQYRQPPWVKGRTYEPFGVEGNAILAIQYPGVPFVFRGLSFCVETTPAGMPALIITLLSGRRLSYLTPSLERSPRNPDEWQIVYWTWNSNPKYGAMGWVPMQTYGGRLTENIVQATAQDVLRDAIIRLRAAGYPTVLHVYDEILVEIPQGTGSVEEVERRMSTMPVWAESWPIRAAGGWRGRRYRKG